MTTLDQKLKAAINAVLKEERPELQVDDLDGMVLCRSDRGPWYEVRMVATWVRYEDGKRVMLREGPTKSFVIPGAPDLSR